jgi:hypothetical protein
MLRQLAQKGSTESAEIDLKAMFRVWSRYIVNHLKFSVTTQVQLWYNRPNMLARRSTSKCNQPIYTKWARQHLGKWRWVFGEASKFVESLVLNWLLSWHAVYHLATVRAATWCGDIVELANDCCFFRKNSKDSNVSFSSTTWHMTSLAVV